MKALILNGAGRLRELALAAEEALASELAVRGCAVARKDLVGLQMPECKGDFGCWTVTPGACVQAGPHRDIARDLIQSDLVAWLTPLTFGGYSSALKSLLDHCIPLIAPFFTTVDGETHHEARYERFPGVLAVGLLEGPDPAGTAVFERLVQRNVLNLHAPRFASPVVTSEQARMLRTQASCWLDALETSQPPRSQAEPLELGTRNDLPAVAARRALLVVGSPRGRESVSASIASHLERLLEEHGVQVSTAWIHRSVREDPGLQQLSENLGRTDVVVLAAPLYVDSLPAPVTEALEILARRTMPTTAARPRFLAIVNCGFPEAVQTDTALAICRLWAGAAGLDWIGGLGIGAGGMLAGKPLAELGGRARTVTRALAIAANAVARGEIVPEAAQRLARTLTLPAWLYRVLGNWGFRLDARRHGTRRLRERPYAA